MGKSRHDTDPVDTEIYDPSTGQWSFAGNLPHGWLGGAMVLLPDGRVLMVDGNQTGSGPFAEAVIFDPATNQWSEAATPVLARSGAAATLLPDGKVLVSQGGQLQSEIYDPVANTYPNNYQGKISYHGVEFDSVGFQCAELTARYFYDLTGQKPPLVPDASEFAYSLNTSYAYTVYPAGQGNGTSTFQSSLAPGQIVSMWSSSDQVGHVAIVTAVNITGGNGTITVIGENGSANGTDTITVSNGQMSYEGLYNNFQWTTNMPS
jgi:hypothetical protein